MNSLCCIIQGPAQIHNPWIFKLAFHQSPLFPSWPQPYIHEHPRHCQCCQQGALGLFSTNPGHWLPVSMKHLGLFTFCEHLHSRTWTKDLCFLQVFGPHQLIDFLTCCSQWVTGAFPKLPFRMWMSFSYPSQSSLVRPSTPIRFTSPCVTECQSCSELSVLELKDSELIFGLLGVV